MGKVHGCWEHMSVVWDKLKSRKTEKSNIAAILMPMDLYHTNCCFLLLADMVFQYAGCLCLLSIMRAYGISAGLIQLLLIGNIT